MLPLIKIYRMNLIATGSISLDSTFKATLQFQYLPITVERPSGFLTSSVVASLCLKIFLIIFVSFYCKFCIKEDIGQLIQTLLKNKSNVLVLSSTVILSNRYVHCMHCTDLCRIENPELFLAYPVSGAVPRLVP